MKTNEMYTNRLLKLARYLGSMHLRDALKGNQQGYSSSKSGSNIEHFAWALEDLPVLFSQ